MTQLKQNGKVNKVIVRMLTITRNFQSIFTHKLTLLLACSFISITAASGQSIISNGSFESWESNEPTDIIIVTDSPDYYKRRTRVYPTKFWDDSISNFFPTRGFDGVSYIGLHSTITSVESIALNFEEKLKLKGRYILNCSTRRLQLSSYCFYDSLAYFITDTLPFQPNIINRDRGGFSKINADKFRENIEITGYLKKTDSINGWDVMEDTFNAKGSEKFLVLFPPLPNTPDSIYYVMFDNIELSLSSSTELNIYFNSNEYNLSQEQRDKLKAWLSQLPSEKVDSILVKGYTDSVGEIMDNIKLSGKRALSVFDFIKSRTPNIQIKDFALGEYTADKEMYKRKVHIKAYLKHNTHQLSVIDSNIIHKLSIAFNKDQMYRNMTSDTRNDHKIKIIDEQNTYLLTELFEEYGYLGVTKLNSTMKDYMGIMTLHQDLDFQIKYLPLIEEACDYRECSPEIFAYLVDKINVAKKKKQIFGTQLYYSESEGKFKPFPISNVKKINLRRKKYGLGKLEDYIKSANPDSNFQNK